VGASALAGDFTARHAQQSRWIRRARRGERTNAIRDLSRGYLSASDKRLHFGLGTAEKAKVEIVWPSGIHQTLDEVHADQFLEVREPEKQQP
jgi:hypothetical protein